MRVLRTPRFRGTGIASGTHNFTQNHFFNGLLDDRTMYMKKILITSLKLGTSLAIIAYLIWKATSTRGPNNVDVFTNLVEEPKDWWMLFWAWVFSAAAVVLTFIRWWYLVRASGHSLPLFRRHTHRFLGISFQSFAPGHCRRRPCKGRNARARASSIPGKGRGFGALRPRNRAIYIVIAGLRGNSDYWILADRSAQIHVICVVTFIITIGGALESP